MGKPKASRIDVPDPLAIIEAEKNANRTDTITPFGSSVWQGDQQVQSFSPQMQAMADKMMGLGMQDSQRIEPPPFLNDLGMAIAGRVGQRYGMDPSQMVGKPQQSMQPPPQSVQPIGTPIEGMANFGSQPPAPSQPPGPNMNEPMPGGGFGGMGGDQQDIRRFLQSFNNMRQTRR